jgi:hypothetical protein
LEVPVQQKASWWTEYLTDEERALFEEVDQRRDQLNELMARKRKAYYRAVRRGERARERERRRATKKKKNGNGQR